METINSLGMLSFRSNIETYQYNDKYIVLYDDHRCLLNILFEALKIGIFKKTPNLYHDFRLFFNAASDVNMRNNIAHGLWGYNEILKHAPYCIWLAIKIYFCEGEVFVE